MTYIDSNTFTTLFEGPAHPGRTSTTSRCGSVHNPPNSTAEYDYADTTAHTSDCLSWFPDGAGTTSRISCQNWGCADVSDSDNAQLNHLVWWMQNFPGKGNQVTLGGRHMRNRWDVHADFDQVATSSKSLALASYPCAGISADGGTLDLSRGPNCLVKFARFVPSSNGAVYYIWVSRQEPEFNAVGHQFTGTSGSKYYSNQVYGARTRQTTPP